MYRLSIIMFLTFWAMFIFNSCGIDIRHSGKVKAEVTIKPDYELLLETCKRELELEDIPEEELTEEENKAIEDCALDKYAQLLETLNANN